MFEVFRRYFNYFSDYLFLNSYNVYSITWAGMIGHPFYYVLWKYIDPQPFDSPALRFIGFCSCVFLFCLRFFDLYRNRFFGFFWFLGIFYNFSFFFTTYFIMNDFSLQWSCAMMIGFSFTIMLFPNFFVFMLNLVLGIGSAIIYTILIKGYDFVFSYEFFITYIPIFAFAIFVGYVISRTIDLKNKERVDSLKSLAGSIAHEMRNPLGVIQLASDALLDDFKNMRADKFSKELDGFKKQIDKTVDLACGVIDINLFELSGGVLDKEKFKHYIVVNLLIDALIVYGYKFVNDIDRVFLDVGDGYKMEVFKLNKKIVNVDELGGDSNYFVAFLNNNAFKFVIFNLIKNALFYVKEFNDLRVEVILKKDREVDLALLKKFKLSSNLKKCNAIEILYQIPPIIPYCSKRFWRKKLLLESTSYKDIRLDSNDDFLPKI